VRRLAIVVETVSAIALGLWAGALAMVGVAAALAFPMMRDMGVRIDEMGSYGGDHWRLVAGSFMNRLFAFVDGVGVVALLVSMVCVFALMLMLRVRRPGAPEVVRLASLVGATAVLGGTLLVVRPAMNDRFSEHLEAAEAGDDERAQEAQEAFAELHGPASNLHAAQLVLAVVALGASVACGITRAGRTGNGS
jgi:hypothetical protein